MQALGTKFSVSSYTENGVKVYGDNSTFPFLALKSSAFEHNDTLSFSYTNTTTNEIESISLTLKKTADGVLDETDLNNQLKALGLDQIFKIGHNPTTTNPYLRPIDSDIFTINSDSASLTKHGTELTSIATAEYKASDAVSFETSVDTKPIVEGIKNMIAEFNVMIGEIKTSYTKLPAQKSNGAPYEPLTDEDTADMTESAIEKYEEKAKQGLLFGDNNLSSLYEKLRFIFSPGGEDGALLQKMGISTAYSSADGALTVTLDEKKLAAMLESDIDAVADVFTRNSNTSGGTDGVMQKMKKVLDTYAATTGATKGILVQKAGTPLSSLTLMNNDWQKEIDRVNEDIARWQDKLSSQVDHYTKQFTRLETLINQMNSQSGALAGLMGG